MEAMPALSVIAQPVMAAPVVAQPVMAAPMPVQGGMSNPAYGAKPTPVVAAPVMAAPVMAAPVMAAPVMAQGMAPVSADKTEATVSNVDGIFLGLDASKPAAGQ